MVILRRFFGIIWPDCLGMFIRFGMESLSGLPCNPYPLSRGITIRFGVEYTLIKILHILLYIISKLIQ
jgi:hypothetical protein